MLCKQCQTDNPANAKFCLSCGAKLGLTCPQCGAQLPSQAKFCLECGAKIDLAPPQAVAAPAPVAAPVTHTTEPVTQSSTGIELPCQLHEQELPLPEPPLSTEPARDVSFLQSFLSRGRCQALRSGQALTKTARGACLFADISGFTPLTEALRKSLQPRQGAEVLNAIINSVFEALISQVHQQGGDVLGFAGDAFTCWFDDPQNQKKNPNVPGVLARHGLCHGLCPDHPE